MFNYPVIEERCSCGASTQTVGTTTSSRWHFESWRTNHICPPKQPVDPRIALVGSVAEAWREDEEVEYGGPNAKSLLFRRRRHPSIVENS